MISAVSSLALFLGVAWELDSLKETLEGSHNLPALAPEQLEVKEAKVEPLPEPQPVAKPVAEPVAEPKREPREMAELLASLDDLVFYTNNLAQKQAPAALAAAQAVQAMPAPASPPLVPVMPAVEAVPKALPKAPPQPQLPTHSLEPVLEPVFPHGPQQWQQLPPEQFSGPGQPDRRPSISGRPLRPHPPQVHRIG